MCTGAERVQPKITAKMLSSAVSICGNPCAAGKLLGRSHPWISLCPFLSRKKGHLKWGGVTTKPYDVGRKWISPLQGKVKVFLTRRTRGCDSTGITTAYLLMMLPSANGRENFLVNVPLSRLRHPFCKAVFRAPKPTLDSFAKKCEKSPSGGVNPTLSLLQKTRRYYIIKRE